jgi:S-adenosylmethionine:tRNA ribosyltransferase-isomerase
MPSAGRPFSGRLVAALAASGVSVAPITLHTGVSSLEAGELPYPERFAVPESTAALINHVKANDGKVIAVGTTVVRALETAADRFGRVHPADSLTDLVVGSGHTLRIVDGLITGWHEAESTHLQMLEAVIDRTRLSDAYEAAVTHEYLWHEFGDSLLMTRS